MSAEIALAGAGLVFALPYLRKAGAPVPVAVTPFVTSSQTAAMGALAPLWHVTLSERAKYEATAWWQDHKDQMLALRPFKVMRGSGLLAALPRTFVLWTPDDYRKLLGALLDATSVGVNAGGYRMVRDVPSLFAGAVPSQVEAFRILSDGGVAAEFLLEGLATPLGRAVYDASLQRRRMQFYATGGLGDADHVELDATVYRLAVEMDNVGYLIAGKPPAPPQVADALAYAADKTASTVAGGVTGVAGSAVGAVAGTVLRSSVFWAAGLALVAWKVLK